MSTERELEFHGRELHPRASIERLHGSGRAIHLERLQTPDPIWRPYAFDRVQITGHTADGRTAHLSLIGACYSEFASGPNLSQLANAAADLIGPGFFGLDSCRPLGFRA